ncbi:MAG: Imm51 family immunity protein [Polyangiales bacterium]
MGASTPTGEGRGLGASALRRAVIAGVEQAQVRAAAAELSEQPGLRWSPRRSPVADLPFVVVDGAYDDAWFAALARRLDAFAASIVVDGTSGEVTWTTLAPGGVGASGVGRGVEPLVRALGGVMITLGEYPAIVRREGSELARREVPPPTLRPLLLTEAVPGTWSLLLDAEGDRARVDGVIVEAGEAPTGYFWTRVARALVERSEATLHEAIEYASEAGMFCARSDDAAALRRLGVWMSWVASDPDAMRALLATGV